MSQNSLPESIFDHAQRQLLDDIDTESLHCSFKELQKQNEELQKLNEGLKRENVLFLRDLEKYKLLNDRYVEIIKMLLIK
jgi:hypothetical protein